MTIHQSEVEYLEKQTRRQANSTVWHEHRAGHITASSAHTVLHTNQDNPAQSVILKITKPATSQINAAPLIYGREKEKEVFKLAGKYLAQAHKDCELSHSGMMVSTKKPWLSASADGIVNCSCHDKRVLEIKCPYSARNQTAEEFLNDQSSYMHGGTLKKNHQYFTQVQLEMYVHDVQTCEFVVYVKDTLIHQTVPRDDEYLAEILPVLEVFWKKHITHELLTRSVETERSQKEARKVFCYCRKEWDGVSTRVKCDGQFCPHQWIHLDCIRPARKTVPRGIWYCKTCLRGKQN